MPNRYRMKDMVVRLLKQNLPVYYFYHNDQHTRYVEEKAMQIGRFEKCTDYELYLLSAAALWHDAGLIDKYIGHEEQSCSLAKKYLPDFGFSIEEIKQVCGMIMATKVPQSPHNKLEQILADADLEYLGTSQAVAVSDLLFRELQYLDPFLTKREWIERQIPFLQQHHYFTNYCKENRQREKNHYLKFLQSQL